MTRSEAARAYYVALDDGDYDVLADLLTPDFVHDRPDRTLEGRDRFVRFVRAERPNPGTIHVVDALCGSGADGERAEEVLARGRVVDDGEVLVRFCDAFAFEDGRIARLMTYTN